MALRKHIYEQRFAQTKLEEELKAVVASPALFAEDLVPKELAKAIVNAPPPPRAEPVKYRPKARLVETISYRG